MRGFSQIYFFVLFYSMWAIECERGHILLYASDQLIWRLKKKLKKKKIYMSCPYCKVQNDFYSFLQEWRKLIPTRKKQPKRQWA